MTDEKKPEDVVVNLFKDTNEHVLSAEAARQLPPDHFKKLVLNQLDVIKEDADKHGATGVMTVLFDDKGPLVDYFAGSINLHMAYVLMDQLKDVILEKLDEGAK